MGQALEERGTPARFEQRMRITDLSYCPLWHAGGS